MFSINFTETMKQTYSTVQRIKRMEPKQTSMEKHEFKRKIAGEGQRNKRTTKHTENNKRVLVSPFL